MNTHAALRRLLVSSLALIFAVLMALPALAAEQPPAGSVKYAEGDVRVVRNGAQPAELKAGDRVYEQDVLTTARGASLGLVLRDNTVLSLGPLSKLTLEKFLFAPEQNSLASVMRLAKGSMACVSGEITKLRPEAAKVDTPIYTLGIRGTHFLINVDGEDR